MYVSIIYTVYINIEMNIILPPRSSSFAEVWQVFEKKPITK